MKPTLLILAAGMGSRYGGLKQMDQFGPHGETIIDYSIYDAINCGYGKVVFIVREKFRKEFSELFESKIAGRIKTEYVSQELDQFLGGRQVPEERTKPWGTAHAVLCARDVIQEPFAVINSDDFYGKDAFVKSADFLNKDVSSRKYCLIGYKLGNTISPYGTVSRGVCEVDAAGHLVGVTERTKVYRKEGQIYYTENESPVPVSDDATVSMNFWGFDASAFDFIQDEFEHFLQGNYDKPKSEFFIPLAADSFIKNQGGDIKVIETQAKWFGVTYREDKPFVNENIKTLIREGAYPEKLW